MAETKKTLSQHTFDRMLRLIQDIRTHGRKQKDNELEAMADRLDALLHNFVNEMIIDGTIADPSLKRDAEPD